MRGLFMPVSALCVLALCGLTACGGGGGGESPASGGSAGDGGGVVTTAKLPVLHAFNATQAARGEALLKEDVLSATGMMPREYMEMLWYAWNPAAPLSGDAFWSAFRERYGLHEAPFDNGCVSGSSCLPLGLREDSSGNVSFDCLLCHAGKIAGQVVIGAPNTTLDLQGLHDDVVTMVGYANMMMPGLNLTPPFTISNKTGAAGATDAFGLAMGFTGVAGVNKSYGYQRPQAWWTIKHKNHLYSDGSGSVTGTGYRPMMATLLAFGATLPDLQARTEDFEDLRHYLLSLPSPTWPKTVDSDAAGRGKLVYESHCLSCHGNSKGFPEKFIQTGVVGTDAVRATAFTASEATIINNSWFGDTPMQARGAYMAPPLTGIWARAPYFHNGSVPTLRAVLDSSSRPVRWQRKGSAEADFDFTNVGWLYTQPASGGNRSTIAGRRIYDTTLSGLANTGHSYGDALSPAQRDDLIEYLKTF